MAAAAASAGIGCSLLTDTGGLAGARDLESTPTSQTAPDAPDACADACTSPQGDDGGNEADARSGGDAAAPMLDVTTGTLPSQANLTALGALDWWHFHPDDRKSTALAFIGPLTPVGSRTFHPEGASPAKYTWTDGTNVPSNSAGVTQSYYYGQFGPSFALDLDVFHIGTSLRIITLDVDASQPAFLRAQVSDGSSTEVKSAPAPGGKRFEIRVRASTVDATLQLAWVSTATNTEFETHLIYAIAVR